MKICLAELFYTKRTSYGDFFNYLLKFALMGVFPWGYAIKTSANRWTYFINAKRFAEIEGIET